MNAVRKKKLLSIVVFIISFAIIIALILYALRQNINLFYSPSQIIEKNPPHNRMMRVGGMVVPGSIRRSEDGLTVTFIVTDYQNTITIHHHGSLPDLFREGQGIIALGKLLNKDEFYSHEVLAKHDENYMPPEVSATLKKARPTGLKTVE